jgi:cobalt-zinc-cadmium resistance protein CzcA
LIQKTINSNKNNSIIPLFIVTEEQLRYSFSYLESVTNIYESQIKLQKQHWLPDLNLDYFRGSNKGLSPSLNGFQLGIAVPFFSLETFLKLK